MNNQRRGMPEKRGLEARNQQAARDALRRRQKEKKAKTVKRHVRYKDKKRLLDMLASTAEAAPIVAPELRRFDSDESPEVGTGSEPQRPVGPDSMKGATGELHTDREKSVAEDEITDVVSEVANASDGAEEITKESGRKGIEIAAAKHKKHLPFSKQVKMAEKMKKEREAEEKERLKRIKTRENMLHKSKKRRREQVCLRFVCRKKEVIARFPIQDMEGYLVIVNLTSTFPAKTLVLCQTFLSSKSKQYRKVTTKGQPVLKHRLDDMLKRLQNEK